MRLNSVDCVIEDICPNYPRLPMQARENVISGKVENSAGANGIDDDDDAVNQHMDYSILKITQCVTYDTSFAVNLIACFEMLKKIILINLFHLLFIVLCHC